MIKIQSKDGEIFVAEKVVVDRMRTIKDMMVNCGIEDDVDALVPVPAVTGRILKLVLAYANYHKDDPILDEDEAAAQTHHICAWDTAFLRVDKGTLFSLLGAAHYLNMSDLLALTSQAVANMMKGMSSSGIRSRFGIENDFVIAGDKAYH